MEYKISQKFDKDLKNINKNTLIEIEKVLEEIENANSLLDIKNIKKLKSKEIAGVKYYRVRIGNYRLGIEIKNENLTLRRFKHRGEIYDVFPDK